jgi:hypothetical protein
MRLREPERTNSQSDGWNHEAAREAAREADRDAAIDARRAETAEDTVDGVAARRNGTSAVGQAVPGATASAWQDIKSRFVDDPAGAVAAAEDMVRQALEERIRALRSEAAGACGPERDGEEPSTEAMRTRLRRCQAYCEQLATSMAH